MKYDKGVETSDREYVYGQKPKIVGSNGFTVEQYATVQANMPIYCVDVFAVGEHRTVLLGRRKFMPAQGFWWPSGGRKFRNEGLQECASRHFAGDTGVILPASRFVYLDHDLLVFEDRQQEPANVGTDTPTTLMGVQLTSEEIKKIKLDGDFDSVRFVSAEEILDGDYDGHVKRGVRGLFDKGIL